MQFETIANKTIPPARFTDVVKYRNGNTGDIMAETFNCFNEENGDTVRLAPYMRGKNLMETCRNLYNLIRDNVRYQEDPAGKQWVKAPRRLWADRVGDCKSYAVFIGSCLKHLGINFYFRFTAFNGETVPTHVYIVVPGKHRMIIVDPAALTLPFNKETPFSNKWDYTMTQINRLGAVPAGARRITTSHILGMVSKGYSSSKPFDTLGCTSKSSINGFINDILFAKGLREQLFAALPGVVPFMIYLYLPDCDDVNQKLPEIVKHKRGLIANDLWNMGAQANIKVETELFPVVRQQIAQVLGMQPEDWWKKVLPSSWNIRRGCEVWGVAGTRRRGSKIGGYADVYNDAVKAAGGVETGIPGGLDMKANAKALEGILAKIGPSLKWKQGGVTAWGPEESDWNGVDIPNPIKSSYTATNNSGNNSNSSGGSSGTTQAGTGTAMAVGLGLVALGTLAYANSGGNKNKSRRR